MKLTAETVQNQPRPERGKQLILRCDEVKGFGVRLTSGSVSYILEAKSNGKAHRLTLGSWEEMTLEQARIQALKLLSNEAPLTAPTLGEVLEKFLATRNLRPTSVRHYRQVVHRCIGDWLGLRIDKISNAMVLERHRELTKPTHQGTDGRAQANKAMEVLRVLLNFAADTCETGSGEAVLSSNPVTALNRHRSWHRAKQRQRVLPDAVLPLWYAEVMKLRPTVRDYLLVLLLTGLRRTECATMTWHESIDFENRIITIPSGITKNGHEHQLPMSDFIVQLLKQRYESQPRNCQFVFPGRGGKGHMVDSTHVISQISHRCGYPFVLHDLRRTMLSMGERLGLTHYMLRRLANHGFTSDITARYIVVDVETLRKPVQRITDEFLRLMGAEASLSTIDKR